MSARIIWTEDKLHYLRDHFPTETAHDIADVLGCSSTSVLKKARELGVDKSPSFRKADFFRRYVDRGKGK